MHKLLSSTSYPVLDNVGLVLSPDEQHPHLLINTNYWSLWTEVLTDTSKFPPVDRVLPPIESLSATAIINPKELIGLIKRLKGIKAESVAIKLGDSVLVISGKNSEEDSWVDLTMPAKISGQIADYDAGLNENHLTITLRISYLVEALTSLGAETTLGFQHPHTAVRIDDGKKTAAVMPIRTYRT